MSLENYNILVSIVPSYFRTQFPYSTVDSEKILLTKRKIKLLVKSDKPDKTLGGKTVKPAITFIYGN